MCNLEAQATERGTSSDTQASLNTHTSAPMLGHAHSAFSLGTPHHPRSHGQCLKNESIERKGKWGVWSPQRAGRRRRAELGQGASKPRSSRSRQIREAVGTQALGVSYHRSPGQQEEVLGGGDRETKSRASGANHSTLGLRKLCPAKRASSPSSSSILMSWLYLARRSERHGAPVLIWPVHSPTTRSAMNVSSVSPER